MKNEPAYPVTPLFENGTNMTHSGLTKLEYFAAKAMQGFCCLPADDWERYNLTPANTASMSVDNAKALIAELEKEQGEE